MRILLTSLILSGISFSVQAEETGHTGVVYGDRHMISVQAPDGWVLDTKSAQIDGVHAALYPKGGSWSESPAIMYANCSANHEPTFSAFIESDIKSFHVKYSQASVKPQSWGVMMGKVSAGRYFEGHSPDDKVDAFEAVTYIEEKPNVCMMVLSAKTKADFEKSIEDYKKFTGSYRFITDNVNIEPKK